MRLLPLPARAVSVLAELQAAAEGHQVHVFVNSKGPARGDRVQRRNTWRDFNAIRERAGLPPCSFHHLRKTYCTDMAEALPIHVVQELAGHSQISTTRNHYLKVGPDFLGKARKVVEALMPD